MNETYVPVKVASSSLLIEVTGAGRGGDEAPSDVNILSRLDLQDVANSIEALSGMMVGAIKKAKPTKASIDFALEVGVESGHLTAILVKGTGKANLTVHIEWGAE